MIKINPAVTATYKIMAIFLEDALEKIDHLSRTASKLGFEVTYTVSDPYAEQVVMLMPVWYNPSQVKRREVEVTFVDITITAPILKVEGNWRVFGVVEHHESLVAGQEWLNVVHTAPGNEVDVREYVDIAPTCDHCGKKRHRKQTVIIGRTLYRARKAEEFSGNPLASSARRKLSGPAFTNYSEIKRVGGSCVKLYLGRLNVHTVLHYMAMFQDLDELAARNMDSEGMVKERRERWLPYVGLILAASCEAMYGGSEEMKWASGHCHQTPAMGYKPSAFGAESTRAFADTYIAENFNPKSGYRIDPKNFDRAKAVLDWALDEYNDPVAADEFVANLSGALAGREYKTPIRSNRDIGLLCYIPEAYRRHVEKVAKQEAVRQERVREEGGVYEGSQHVGGVDEKLTSLELTLLTVRFFTNDFGDSAFFKAVDANGNLFQWYASPLAEFDLYNEVPQDFAGVKVYGSAKVKDHLDTDNGLATQLYHCKLNVRTQGHYRFEGVTDKGEDFFVNLNDEFARPILVRKSEAKKLWGKERPQIGQEVCMSFIIGKRNSFPVLEGEDDFYHYVRVNEEFSDYTVTGYEPLKIEEMA